MYKVFFNQKSIVLTVPENITLFKTYPVYVESFSREELKQWFGEFAENDNLEAVLVHPDQIVLFQFFQSVFHVIRAAGGVVLKKDKLLFIFRNGKWDLPKGKIDSGETIEETALREVEEECGIGNLQIISKLPSTYHIYQSPYKKTFGEWIFKETFWFEMNYSGSENGIPQEDEGITEVHWFDRNELDTVLENTYENLKQIIRLYRG
jgi:8-oxo-dGTP pyrophosphatase MutT (NUDIX family)